MEHAFNTLTETRLTPLRVLEKDGAVVPGRHIVPGVWFVADTDEGEMEGRFSSTPDTLLRFRFDVRKPGRWLSFNVAVDGAALPRDHVLGVIVETSSPTPVPFQFGIRSGRGKSFVDSPFADSHVAGPGRKVQVSLLEIGDAPALQEPAPWRNLRMVFTPASFDLCLHDARIFIAAAGAFAPQTGTALPDLAARAG